MCNRGDHTLGVDDVTAFAASALHDRPRILVVADRCEIAEKLVAVGFAATTIGACDAVDAPDTPVIQARLQALDGERFRAAVLCDVAWLPELPNIVARVQALLEHDARVIIDDIDVQALDRETIAWFLDTSERAANAAGRAAAERLVERWLGAKRVVPSVATTMLESSLPDFVVRAIRNVECLYRHIVRMLPPGAPASSAAELRDAERRAIEAGTIHPVGIQIVAERGGPACESGVTREIRCTLRPGHDGLHFWRSTDGSRTFEWG